MHAADPASSVRLARTLEVLRGAGARGLTTWELQEATGSMAPATDVSELRAAGYQVACAYEGRSSNGRKAYRYTLATGGQLALAI